MRRAGETVLAAALGLLFGAACITMSNAGPGPTGFAYFLGAGSAAYFYGAASSYLWAPQAKRTPRHRWHVVMALRIWLILIAAAILVSLIPLGGVR